MALGPVLATEAVKVCEDELKNCIVGQLANTFGVNHIKIVCKASTGIDSAEKPAELPSETREATRSALDVLMGAARADRLPVKRISRYS